MSKRGLRIVEVLVIVLVIVVGGLLGLNAIGNAWFRAKESKSRTLCASHLKQWSSVLAMYSDESKEGLYPPIRTAPTVSLVADLSILCPQYLSDLSMVTCPSDIEATSPFIDLKPLPPDVRRRVLAGLNPSYSYLGWVFDRTNDVPEQCLSMDKVPPTLDATWNELPDTSPPAIPGRERRLCRQMAFTIDKLFCQPSAVETDIRLDSPDGNLGTSTVYRLRKGVERMLTTDSNASREELAKVAAGIPVMLDTFTYSPTFSTFMHMPGGSNVLFLDGHVAFYKYPGEGPVNRPVGSLLGILEAIKERNP